MICGFSEILSKVFVDMDKLILKSVWRTKGPRIAGIILKEKKLENLHHPGQKATVIQTVCKMQN